MVELRKRPQPSDVAPPPLAKRNSSKGPVKKALDKAKAAVTGTGAERSSETNGATSKGKIEVGTTITLAGFGGELETHSGTKTTLKDLVEASGAGVVLFTYPKASTPGCTTQACLFRDHYAPITGASLSVFGLSTDSPKSNTTFATKQNLPFQLLCDPGATLISAIGMKKPPKSTARGVVIIDKQGKVRVWEQAGPQKTLDAVLAYIKHDGMTETGGPAAVAAPTNVDDPHASEEAAKLADPDTKMDEVPLTKEASKEEVEAAETAAEVGETAKMLDAPAETKE